MLFSPIGIGTMTVPNRIVLASIDSKLGNAEGEITPAHVAYMGARARGGVGLLMTDNLTVEWPRGKTGVKPLRLDNDRYICSLGDLAEEVHHWGAKVVAQLSHAGRQTTLNASEGIPLVSASAVGWAGSGTTPVELASAEIAEVVEKFASAAWRAQQAGCDGVEIHAAHGYLLSSFLSPYTNKRTDEYGGSLENRLRLLLRVIECTRERVGGDYPLFVRFNGSDYVEGGLTVDDAVEIGRRLEVVVDALDVSAGMYESDEWTFPGMPSPEGVLVPLAAAVKEAVNIPVIAVGKIRSPEQAEQVLQEGHADLIAMARTLIADPEWPIKVKMGHTREIRPCISCNDGCLGRISRWLRMGCNVNADVGHEGDSVIRCTGRFAMVIGGGPAGLEVARRLAEHGCRVELYEREEYLGGQLRLAAKPQFNRDLRPYLNYLIEAAERAGVSLTTGVTVDAEFVRERAPDAVVLATGARPTAVTDGIAVSLPVVTALEALDVAPAGASVLVVGAGSIGCEVAAYLALAGRSVTIVEAQEEVGGHLEQRLLAYLRRVFDEHDVHISVGTTYLGVEDKHAKVSSGGKAAWLACDAVVLATGMEPNPVPDLSGGLFDDLLTFRIGDALAPRTLYHCVNDAASIADAVITAADRRK